nr:hypothetical protein [Bizionia myxarmorum]
MAFVLVGIFACVILIYGQYVFGLMIMLMNIIINLYPSLLQQKNKRRLDKLIQNK